MLNTNRFNRPLLNRSEGHVFDLPQAQRPGRLTFSAARESKIQIVIPYHSESWHTPLDEAVVH